MAGIKSKVLGKQTHRCLSFLYITRPGGREVTFLVRRPYRGGDRACSGFFWLLRGKSLERLGGKRCDRNKPGGWMILDTLEGVAGLLVV